MVLSLIFSKLDKYNTGLRELNRRERWGLLRSVTTYFDYASAYIRHGCLLDQYVNGNFYSYRSYFRKRVITQRRLEKIIRQANSDRHIHLLEDKTHFNNHFQKWVRRRWLSSQDMTAEEFSRLCSESKALFIKPLDSYEGKGIRRVDSPDHEHGRRKLFESLKTGKYIIEQELKQHELMTFGNKSVNTLRINTLLSKTGGVILFKPVLRTGIGDAFVDNYNAGGVEYSVDVGTGIITMPGYAAGKVQHIYHPGTDIKMVGYRIPMWNEVVDNVTEAARHIPQCRYVGWDVAITPDGIEFIEGNHNPGYVCMEYFGQTGWYEKIKQYL